MTLFDRIKKDNQRILTNDMDNITLINPANISETGKGRWTDIGFGIDPQGLPFASKSYKVDFHIDNFSIITNANETFKGWKASFVNNQGDTIQGTFNKPLVDKTFGYVSIVLNPYPSS